MFPVAREGGGEKHVDSGVGLAVKSQRRLTLTLTLTSVAVCQCVRVCHCPCRTSTSRAAENSTRPQPQPRSGSRLFTGGAGLSRAPGAKLGARLPGWARAAVVGSAGSAQGVLPYLSQHYPTRSPVASAQPATVATVPLQPSQAWKWNGKLGAGLPGCQSWRGLRRVGVWVDGFLRLAHRKSQERIKPGSRLEAGVGCTHTPSHHDASILSSSPGATTLNHPYTTCPLPALRIKHTISVLMYGLRAVAPRSTLHARRKPGSMTAAVDK